MRRCPTCGAEYRGRPEVCPVDGGALVDVPDPLIGRLIGGRYRVEARIGAGGMGTVYRARHEVLERDVAVKVLAPELARDPTHRVRFLREARAANRIRHEHIIDITDCGESDDGLVYLVMEYLEGVPLMQVIRRGPLDLKRALRIALQMAWALGRAHELDVVHRDIKPDNVYLLESHGGDFVKILDFGLAHVKGDVRLTAAGTVFGTPEYMAPEQARGMRATGATDLYALGCVLFEMITGRLPFRGAATALILKHIREPAPRLSSLVPGVSPALDDLVASLLEKDPQARPASAYELAEALGSLLDQRSGLTRPAVPGAVTSDPPAGPRHSRTRWHPRSRPPEDVWVQRVTTLREAQARAYPDGGPGWLRDALDALEARATRLSALQAERDQRLTRVSELEQELRETQLRIGHALDTLARDAAQATAHMRESETPLREALRRRAALESELSACWSGLPPPPGRQPLDRAHVERALRLGEVAGRWLDADRQAAELERALLPWQRQCEDLRFQVTQLKGRLGSVSADMEYEIGQLKEEGESLDRQARALLDELAHAVDPVMQHLLAFPDLRPLLLGASDVASPGA